MKSIYTEKHAHVTHIVNNRTGEAGVMWKNVIFLLCFVPREQQSVDFNTSSDCFTGNRFYVGGVYGNGSNGMLNVSTISEHLSYVSGLSICAHSFKRGLGVNEGTFCFYFIFLYHVLVLISWMMYFKVFCVEKRIIFNQFYLIELCINRYLYRWKRGKWFLSGCREGSYAWDWVFVFSLVFFFSFEVLRCKYKKKHTYAHDAHTHTQDPCAPAFLRVEPLLSFRHNIQASSSWSCRRSPSVWSAVFGVKHREAPSV